VDEASRAIVCVWEGDALVVTVSITMGVSGAQFVRSITITRDKTIHPIFALLEKQWLFIMPSNLNLEKPRFHHAVEHTRIWRDPLELRGDE
jgi:hypothetical protein